MSGEEPFTRPGALREMVNTFSQMHLAQILLHFVNILFFVSVAPGISHDVIFSNFECNETLEGWVEISLILFELCLALLRKTDDSDEASAS